jgi:putative membrane protein
MDDVHRYERFQTKELILRDELAIDRTKLANDRTLLSFLRTALTLLLAGLTIIHLVEGPAWQIFGWFLSILGPVILLAGVLRYRAVKATITTGLTLESS